MKILLATPNAPWPAHTGSAQRTALLYEALCELGSVSTICLQNPENVDSEQKQVLAQDFGMVAMVRRWGNLSREPWLTLSKVSHKNAARIGNFFCASKHRYLPDQRSINSLNLEQLLDGVDLIVGRYVISVASLGLIGGNIPCLIDVDDLDSAAFLSEINSTSTPIYRRFFVRRHYNNIKRLEQRVLSSADGLWIANPEDKQHHALANAHYLPNIPFYEPEDDTRRPTQTISQPVVGVIASFKHLPNSESIDWFLENVWPNVLTHIPNAVFKIFGSQLVPSLERKWSRHPNVDVVGFVENVATAYASMSLSICAVQRGAGTNIKVLESGKFKRLCVVTQFAARGITNFQEMKDALIICDSAAHMSNELCYYLADNDATKSAAMKLHAAVEQHYSKKAFINNVHSLVHQVLTEN